jgi:hypothetical protein
VARFFTGLFSGPQTAPPATALRVNTSLQGVPIALLLGGQQRLAGNLIDNYNFNNQSVKSGKGGTVASLFKGQGQTEYFSTFLLALGEGPLELVSAWINGSPVAVTSTSTSFTYPGPNSGNATAAFEFFAGDYAQTPWPYTEAVNASHALGYRGVAYAAFENFNLGAAPSLPNLNFELLATANTGALPGQPDGHASVALTAFLTNEYYGVGFPSFRLGSLSIWQNYCVALGMAVSPVAPSAVQAQSFCTDLTSATNSAACWQDGALTVVPYGDTTVTAGAVTPITETHDVPVGTPVISGNTTLYYPVIVVGFVGTFAADGGVTYASGSPFTKVGVYAPTGVAGTGSPGVGQYYEEGGTYYFNPADTGQEIYITYDYAATASYVPDTTSLYAFTADDCLPLQATIGTGYALGNSPFLVVRKARDQMLNDIKVEYLDRDNQYNPVDVELKDEAAIEAYGRIRPSSIKQFHFFCLASAAQQSAALQLIRAQIPRTFQWTCGRHFMLILGLMKLVTVTDPGQGLNAQPVRITEIEENEDFSLTITAEEFLGTVSAPQYGVQDTTGYAPNYNESPGGINTPIIFEPPAELIDTNSLGGAGQVWFAVSGVNPALWGGCTIWASYDGVNYDQVGSIVGGSRMGVTTSVLPAVTPNASGATIDQADTLGVNLSESAGTLASVTQAAALALSTVSYVGGELIAYETATLTAPNEYDLSFLVRGAYGTESDIATWPIGTPFARLDDNVVAFAFDQSKIGAVLYLKFPSFNIFEGGGQSLAACTAFTHTIAGTALASPLPDVTDLYASFEAGFEKIFWDEVSDFRNAIVYEIRQGSSWETALFLRTQAHPPYTAQGDGTFWVAARCQPVPGLIVYSETPSSITIGGNQLSLNLLAGYDEQATGWTGTLDNGIAIVGSDLQFVDPITYVDYGSIAASATTTIDYGSIASPAATDLDYGPLSDTDTSDVLVDTTLYYEIPQDHWIIAAGVVNASVNVNAGFVGTVQGQNELALTDFLGQTDFLGAAATSFIDGWTEIAVAQTLTSGIPNWGAWQTFVPNVYPAIAWKFRVGMLTTNGQALPTCVAFNYAVQLPARVDHYQNQTVFGAGQTIVFGRDGSGTPSPFNGGPGANDVPFYSVSWQATAGDTFTVTGLSLSQMTIKFFNGGSPVTRTGVNITVEGW